MLAHTVRMAPSRAPDRPALEPILRSVLPSLSLALDGAIEAAALARPGTDAELHAAGVRALAEELETLGRALAALADPALQDYSAAA